MYIVGILKKYHNVYSYNRDFEIMIVKFDFWAFVI